MSANYALFFQISPDMFLVLDIQGHVLETNIAGVRVLGWPPWQIRGKHALDFIHPEDRERTQFELDQLSIGNVSANFETRCQHRDGRYRWISWTGATPADRSSILLIGRDVTSTKESWLRVAQRENFFHTLVDQVSSYIFHVDTKGSRDYSNAAWLNFTGRSLSSEQGQGWSENIHPADQPTVLKNWKTALDSKAAFEHCYRIKNKFGDYQEVHEKCSPHVENSIFLGFWGLATSAGAEQSQSQYLTKRTNVAILHSAKMASLGEMAGGIAHEINNPIAIIQGRAQHMRERIESGELNSDYLLKGISKIEEVTNRIIFIIKSLRSFSRNAEKDPFSEVPLQQIINETLELCRERLKNHNVELRVSPIPDISISCRGPQISQVLLNLLNNAHDAVLETESPWIMVRVSDLVDQVEISVIDSGHGIPAEIADRIMEPFFTTKDIGKGTGLGLSIAKGLVEDHRGELKLDRNSSNTRFVVILPKVQTTK